MATPVTVMGVEAGINLINQLNHVECIIKAYYFKTYNIGYDPFGDGNLLHHGKRVPEKQAE